MKDPKPYIAVVGAGAVGGLLAASLRRAGRRVLLVTSREGALRIRRRGLTIVRGGRRRTLRGWLGVAHRPRRRPGCAAVFLCVKEPQLARALAAIRPIVGPETVGVSMLNGVAHAPAFRRFFGPRRGVIAVTYYAAMRTAPTVVRHTGGSLIALARGRGNRAAVRAVEATLAAAGWHVKIYGDAQRLLWTKMVFNAGVNPLGALARASNGRLADDAALRELMTAVVREAAAVARAAGKPPYHRDVAGTLVRSCRAVKEQMNSMVQDMEAGRPTEADTLLKPLLAAGRRHGTPTPLLTPLYAMVRALEGELA